jgi:hypothetical protein
MTKQELNRDVKRLVKSIKSLDNTNLDTYYKQVNEIISKEFKRLYYADDSFSSLSANNIRMMLRINLKFRFIPFHNFGLNIDL